MVTRKNCKVDEANFVEKEYNIIDRMQFLALDS